MKEIKKINEIISSMSKDVTNNNSMNKKQELLMIEILYLLLSDKEFAKQIQEKL